MTVAKWKPNLRNMNLDVTLQHKHRHLTTADRYFPFVSSLLKGSVCPWTIMMTLAKITSWQAHGIAGWCWEIRLNNLTEKLSHFPILWLNTPFMFRPIWNIIGSLERDRWVTEQEKWKGASLRHGNSSHKIVKTCSLRLLKLMLGKTGCLEALLFFFFLSS